MNDNKIRSREILAIKSNNYDKHARFSFIASRRVRVRWECHALSIHDWIGTFECVWRQPIIWMVQFTEICKMKETDASSCLCHLQIGFRKSWPDFCVLISVLSIDLKRRYRSDVFCVSSSFSRGGKVNIWGFDKSLIWIYCLDTYISRDVETVSNRQVHLELNQKPRIHDSNVKSQKVSQVIWISLFFRKIWNDVETRIRGHISRFTSVKWLLNLPICFFCPRRLYLYFHRFLILTNKNQSFCYENSSEIQTHGPESPHRTSDFLCLSV